MKAILCGVTRHHNSSYEDVRVGFWGSGIDALGVGCYEELDPCNPNQFGDVIISWGIRRAAECQSKAINHVVMEMGFLGDRTTNFYVGYSGLNGAGRPLTGTIDGRGAQWAHLLKPHRKRDAHQRVVFLAQVPHDTSLINLHAEDEPRMAAYLSWSRSVVDHLRLKGKSVGFKFHPKDPIHFKDGMADLVRDSPCFSSMDEVAEWADAAVAFSSNSLVEAFIAGIDVIPACPTSLTWGVRSRLDNPRVIGFSEKIRWLDAVATYQYSTPEIVSGDAWRAVLFGS